MTRPTTFARVVRRVVQLTVILLGALLIGAGPTSASPSIPGIPDCKDAPAPQRPGDGLAGFLDPAPEKPAPPGDPFAPNPTTSIYDQYGYAGLTWHTYDLGCAGSLSDPGATADTMIGNLSLSVATWGIALANGVHNRVAHPQTYMAPLDSVVANVSDRIKAAIWGPWGGVALLGVVALLLWYSSSGQLSTVTRAAAWALLVLTVLSGVTQYPTRIAAFFDDAVTTTIGQVNAATAGLTTLPHTADPAHAQGSLLVDRILYEAWLRGELGSSESAAAKKWGPTLFKAAAFSHDEARQAQNPQRAQELAEQKNQTFKDTADQIQREDPTAYLALQGKTNSRGGVGVMSLFAMLFTTLFRLVADVGVVEAVERHPPAPADADDPSGPQQPQRVADRGLRQPGRRGQVADAQLAALQQGRQQPQPPRLTEQREHLRQVLDLIGGGHRGPDRGHLARVQRPHPAPVKLHRRTHRHACASVHT